MCTVTVVPAGRAAFRLVSNRDERLTRPAAESPRLHRLGERTAIFPVDPAGGGTWVGVNDAGLAAAILNRSNMSVARPFEGRESRGLIIPRCLSYGDLNAALQAVGELPLGRFAPFSLVLVYRQSVAAATSDGRTLTVSRIPLFSPQLFTSSSLGDDLVEHPRRELFGELVLDGPAARWLDGQAAFHQHQWPALPQISVRMARADAATVSRSIVDVSPQSMRLRYERITPAGAEIAA